VQDVPSVKSHTTYTIAIILHEKLGPALNNFFVSIHATNIDAKAL